MPCFHCRAAESETAPPPLEWDGKLVNTVLIMQACRHIMQSHTVHNIRHVPTHSVRVESVAAFYRLPYSDAEITERQHVPVHIHQRCLRTRVGIDQAKTGSIDPLRGSALTLLVTRCDRNSDHCNAS